MRIFSFRQADRAALHIKDGHFVDVVRVIDYHDALTHVREKCIMIIVVVFDGDTAFVDHPLLGIAAQKTKGIMVADNPLYGQIFGINSSLMNSSSVGARGKIFSFGICISSGLILALQPV